MSFLRKLIRTCTILIAIFYFDFTIANGTINFKTTVIAGTCEFDSSNDLNKSIDFNKYYIVSDVEKKTIMESIDSKDFSYLIRCKDFPEGSEKNITLTAKPASGTNFDNGVFFGSNDKTNTGFKLAVCDGENLNCQKVDVENKTIFTTNSDSLIGINYKVSFVKRAENVTSGISNAAVILEYIQEWIWN